MKRNLAALFVALLLVVGTIAVAQSVDPVTELEAAQHDIAEAMVANNTVRGELEQAASKIASALAALTTTTTASTTTTTAATTTTLATTTTTTAPTTTTTAAPTTTTAPNTGCTGLSVPSGANLVTVASNALAGTTFCLAAGTYNVTGSGIPLQNGDRFVGAPGRLSILDGGDSATKAFTCTCSGGALVSLVMQNFATPLQQGPTGPGLTSWLFDNIESRFQASDGLHAHDGAIIRNSYFHHNGEIGLGGQGDNVLIENNETSFNNQNLVAGRGGGSKWVNTVNLTVRGNYSHDNLGPGLWTDGSNIHTTYQNNRVENNDGAGIFHELGGPALIANNRVTCNGGAGEIYISNARGTATDPIIVRDNIVGQHCNGAVASLAAKDDPNRSPRLGYVRFENNQVTADNVVAGVFGTNPIVAPGIEFVSNDYTTTRTNPFRWADTFLTWVQWQALGFDLTGSIG